MVAGLQRINIPSRARLLSEQFNNEARMRWKGLASMLTAAQADAAYLAGASGTTGVIGGLMVRAVKGTTLIEVSPGVAIVADTPASATYDPPMSLISVEAAIQIDIAGLIDANPRLVTIEIQPTEVTKVTANVDQFDEDTGVFTVSAQPIVVGPEAVVVANAGTPSLTPTVASGTPGNIPLAVVKIAGGMATFGDDFAPVLMCRPRIEALGERLMPGASVTGGGLSVGEVSGGVFVNLTTVDVSECSCTLRGLDARVAGRIAFATNGRTPNTTTPAALLGATRVVYAYACPPPWGSGYGVNVAPREAWQRNPNGIATSDVQSVIGGDGDTFLSLLAESTPFTGRALKNAIIVWDSVAPVAVSSGAGGAPLRCDDLRAPHSTIAGGGTLTLDNSQDPTWGATQQVADAVYLGAVAVIGGSFMAQVHRGRGMIDALDKVDALGSFAATRRPIASYNTAQADAPFYPGRYPSMAVGNTEILPNVAGAVALWLAFRAGTGPGTAAFNVVSDHGFGRPDAGAIVYSGTQSRIDTGTASNYELAAPLSVHRSTTGTARVTLTLANANTLLTIMLAGYEDAVIACR